MMSSQSKMKEMEKENNQLKVNNSGADATLHLLQIDLHKAQSIVVEKQKELEQLRLRYQKSCEREAEFRKDADYWQTKHNAKAAELTECKNALFDMQAPNQVPDSQIAEQWSRLCRAIEQWVEDCTQHVAKYLRKELKLFFESERVRAAMKDRISDYWDEKKLEATPQCADRLEYLVRLSIHSLLEESVFDTNMDMIGLRISDVELISHIHKLLGKLTPPRGKLPFTYFSSVVLTAADESSIALWRSEAVKALCLTNDYPKLRQKIVEDIIIEGKKFLDPLILKESDKAFKCFEQDIVEAAVDLDRTMRQSTASYFFFYEPHLKEPSQSQRPVSSNQIGRLLFSSCFRIANVIDIETGKKYTSKNVMETDDQAPIGQRTLNIVPALCCRRGNNQIALDKQLILAEMLTIRRLKSIEKTVSGGGSVTQI